MKGTPGASLYVWLVCAHPAGAAGERLGASRRTRRVFHIRDGEAPFVQGSGLNEQPRDPATAGAGGSDLRDARRPILSPCARGVIRA